MRDLERVTELGTIERLAQRLPDLVGSPLSLNSLREDLQVSHNSIARWRDILERLYYIYRLSPFGGPKIKAVKKEAKHNHFDWSLVKDPGARFENLVAGHFLKWTHFQIDTQGRDLELRYFRDIEGREVDIVITEHQKPVLFVEVKLAETTAHRSLIYLKNKYPAVECVQIIKTPDVDFTSKDGMRVVSALTFLRALI